DEHERQDHTVLRRRRMQTACHEPASISSVSLTNRVLLGLLTGFVLGLALAGSSSPAVATLLAFVAPVGTIFINLIRMTVIPLVASMLIASVASRASSGALGRAGARAAVIAVVFLAITALVTVLIATPVFARINIDP